MDCRVLYVLLLAVLAASSLPAPRLEPNPQLMTIGKHVDLIVEFFSKLYYPLFEGSSTDPTRFYDFTYEFSGYLEGGEANITNPMIIGMSKFNRRITINRERQEIGLHIEFPQVYLVGSYSLRRTEGGCPDWGCFNNTWTGNGAYNHSFTGVTFDAMYTLDNSTDPAPDGWPSIRYTPNHFYLNIESASLYADNFEANGNPWDNWEKITEDWLSKWIYDDAQIRINNILFGEASSLVMNYSSRLLVKSAKEILDELLRLGGELIP